ncbi:unnamed protein product [Bursaphelenchus xylophilus]|uniref:Hexosyltransferase n=1 Tax=Bursaphelenchus xylophilus TaxID=6326 RepID=A0A1I7RQC5_BURXY|nr:unnamed protein product [Bursaphelenchus xylophilus]CAG9104360.1 unnamed protein product [Bursaphelenchus xylophilus]
MKKWDLSYGRFQKALKMSKIDLQMKKRYFPMLAFFLMISLYIAVRPLLSVDFTAIFKNISFTYRFTETGGSVCQGSDVVVLVLSKPGNFGRRQMIRDSWLYDANNPRNFSTKFLLGLTSLELETDRIQEEVRKHKDIVIYNAEDKYDLLPLKVHAAYSFANYFCPKAKYLVKTDDDTVLDLKRLNYFIGKFYNSYLKANNEFMFCSVYRKSRPKRSRMQKYYMPKTTYPHKFYPRFCQGCTYVVTQAAIKRLLAATATVEFISLEDVLYTGLIRQNTGVALLDSLNLGYNSLAKTTPCDSNGTPYPCAQYGIEEQNITASYEVLKSQQCSSQNLIRNRETFPPFVEL